MSDMESKLPIKLQDVKSMNPTWEGTLCVTLKNGERFFLLEEVCFDIERSEMKEYIYNEIPA